MDGRNTTVFVQGTLNVVTKVEGVAAGEIRYIAIAVFRVRCLGHAPDEGVIIDDIENSSVEPRDDQH